MDTVSSRLGIHVIVPALSTSNGCFAVFPFGSSGESNWTARSYCAIASSVRPSASNVLARSEASWPSRADTAGATTSYFSAEVAAGTTGGSAGEPETASRSADAGGTVVASVVGSRAMR